MKWMYFAAVVQLLLLCPAQGRPGSGTGDISISTSSTASTPTEIEKQVTAVPAAEQYTDSIGQNLTSILKNRRYVKVKEDYDRLSQSRSIDENELSNNYILNNFLQTSITDLKKNRFTYIRDPSTTEPTTLKPKLFTFVTSSEPEIKQIETPYTTYDRLYDSSSSLFPNKYYEYDLDHKHSDKLYFNQDIGNVILERPPSTVIVHTKPLDFIDISSYDTPSFSRPRPPPRPPYQYPQGFSIGNNNRPIVITARPPILHPVKIVKNTFSEQSYHSNDGSDRFNIKPIVFGELNEQEDITPETTTRFISSSSFRPTHVNDKISHTSAEPVTTIRTTQQPQHQFALNDPVDLDPHYVDNDVKVNENLSFDVNGHSVSICNTPGGCGYGLSSVCQGSQCGGGGGCTGGQCGIPGSSCVGGICPRPPIYRPNYGGNVPNIGPQIGPQIGPTGGPPIRPNGFPQIGPSGGPPIRPSGIPPIGPTGVPPIRPIGGPPIQPNGGVSNVNINTIRPIGPNIPIGPGIPLQPSCAAGLFFNLGTRRCEPQILGTGNGGFITYPPTALFTAPGQNNRYPQGGNAHGHGSSTQISPTFVFQQAPSSQESSTEHFGSQFERPPLFKRKKKKHTSLLDGFGPFFGFRFKGLTKKMLKFLPFLALLNPLSFGFWSLILSPLLVAIAVGTVLALLLYPWASASLFFSRKPQKPTIIIHRERRTRPIWNPPPPFRPWSPKIRPPEHGVRWTVHPKFQKKRVDKIKNRMDTLSQEENSDGGYSEDDLKFENLTKFQESFKNKSFNESL